MSAETVLESQNGGQTGCGDKNCQVTQVLLNTGYDQGAGAPYSSSALPIPDGYWQLVNSPNTGLTVPTPAWVITPNGAWNTLAQSNWISAYNTNAQNANNPAPDPPYSFQRCFCTCPGVESVNINLTVLVDDLADIYFDTTLIGSISVQSTNNFHLPGTPIKKTLPVTPGTHCIRVDVRNTGGTALGVDITGTITSASPPGAALFLSPTCCQPLGKVIGQKFNDVNCDGKIDSNDLPLPGWTIVATNTNTGQTFTSVTDANGWYYFNSLPAPGTYTISEQQQSGWSQTVPGTPGTYTVTLAAGQVIQRDFANCKRQCARITVGDISCKPGNPGSYNFTFNLTNLSGVTMFNLIFTPLGAFTITPPSPMPLNPPLQNGQTTSITVTLSGGVKSGDCFTVTLVGFNGSGPEPVRCDNCCCSVNVCIPQLPDCNCVKFHDESVKPVPNSPGTYTYSFCVDNFAAYTVTAIYFYAPSGVTITPSFLPVSPPLASGQTFCGSVTISGATPGTQLQFGVSLHDQGLTQCCGRINRIRIP